MRDDGEMARLPELDEFSRKHGVMILSVADMIAYRLERERIVRERGSGSLRPGCLGPGPAWTARYFDTQVEDTEYLALVRGDVAAASAAGQVVMVRVQSLDPLGDPFGVRPDLDDALRTIDAAGLGVCLYVYSRSRTTMKRAFDRHVLGEVPAAAAGRDASSEALRDFGLGAQVLAELGCKQVRLLANSDRKIVGIEGFGIEIVDRVAVPRGGVAPAGA
jgi:3,4-dihydroxy 2-butanone 4-phosphate synthase/GTP cyclohydrolase II